MIFRRIGSTLVKYADRVGPNNEPHENANHDHDSTLVQIAHHLSDSLCLLTLYFVFHQIDVVVHFLCKITFGQFYYVTLFFQTFGLAEIVVAQASPIDLTSRFLIYATPSCFYILQLVLTLLIVRRLDGVWRLVACWMILFSASYAFHELVRGTLFQSGALGTVADQQGHIGAGATLSAVLIVVIVRLALQARAVQPSWKRLGVWRILFPIVILASYRMLSLTSQAAMIYKSMIIVGAIFLSARFGHTIVDFVLPSSRTIRYCWAALMIAIWISLPASDRYLRNDHQPALQKRIAESFPRMKYRVGEDLLLVADEECGVVIRIDPFGSATLLENQIEAPETLSYDASADRILLSGKRQVISYDRSSLRKRVLVDDWERSPIECLAGDENGILVGFANQITRIDDDGVPTDLRTLTGPDSLLPLGRHQFMVGTTIVASAEELAARSHASPSGQLATVFIFDSLANSLVAVDTDATLNNVEVLVKENDGSVLVGIGSRVDATHAQIGRLEPNGGYKTIARIADVEGIALNGKREIIFSNDELGTVFKVSPRGGIYPLIHLFDPDDIVFVPGATTATP